MPTPTIKKMGKAKGPAFVDNLTNASPVKKKNAPVLILIVGGGVAAIWYLRSHSSANTVGSTTNPAVSINGGNAPDQSTIDNLTASILALQGLQNGNTTNPGGGASTPITTTPVATTPAAAAANNPTANPSIASIIAPWVQPVVAGGIYTSPEGATYSGTSVASTVGPAGVTIAQRQGYDAAIAGVYERAYNITEQQYLQQVANGGMPHKLGVTPSTGAK